MADENNSFPDISVIWPKWKITERIGAGSFGFVYKAIHETAVVDDDAVAIKVINIPKEDSEIANRKLDGASEEDIRKEFEEIRDEYVNEIKFMMDFRDTPNVARIEDYEVVPKKDSIGWIIYIRMELMTDLRSWLNNNGFNERTAIKIGKDICDALKICESKNVLHRDIKPSNILINTSTNTFKLSDFGVAKYNDSLNGSLSSKGTPDFMAPEVAKFLHYDSRIDTYSLGLVLYYFMNRRHGPFLDLSRTPTPSEMEEAKQRRFQGELLPPPKDAAPALAEVILHACAHDPNDRFQSAQEFYDALCRVEARTYRVGTYVPKRSYANANPQGEYNPGTIRVRRAQGAPAQGMVPAQVPTWTPAQAPVRGPSQVPSWTQPQVPARAPVQVPSQVPSWTPSQVSPHVPSWTQPQVPAQKKPAKPVKKKPKNSALPIVIALVAFLFVAGSIVLALVISHNNKTANETTVKTTVTRTSSKHSESKKNTEPDAIDKIYEIDSKFWVIVLCVSFLGLGIVIVTAVAVTNNKNKKPVQKNGPNSKSKPAPGKASPAPAPAAKVIVCKNCGNKQDAGSAFCDKCGKALK
ncbi:MAG: protein kinase [Clostridiales bacterium]|nr:protein kinase [Clostridiales bacterium]